MRGFVLRGLVVLLGIGVWAGAGAQAPPADTTAPVVASPRDVRTTTQARAAQVRPVDDSAPAADPVPPGAPVAGAPDPEGADSAPDADARDPALAAFVAGAVEAMRARTGIAGVIVSVVRDDRTLLVDGYGLARVDPPVPADGESSMFRIGSVSKTFTYTAAMQLVEAGKLALDDAVNERLPETLRVPDDGFAEPIRVRHLLTHTAGWEDIALGHLFQRDPARDMPLARYLVEHRPRRVRAPGAAAAYSNYGVALLGAVVAHASGVGFEDYVEQNLTGPLGMARTTFREPDLADPLHRLDASIGANIATGYERSGGRFEAGWFEHIAHGAPAGSASATAADMARWMRMHLAEGRLDGATILQPDSAIRMRDVLHRAAPGVDGIAWGFLTERYGPYFAYGHGGATLYFHTAMILVPELELGVFVSANTANARQPVRDLARLIVEHVEPRARPAPVPAAAVDRAALQPYVGAYRSNRRPYATVEKLLLSVGGDATVGVADDGTLRVQVAGETKRYVPTGAHRFQEADGNTPLEFLLDDGGRVRAYVYGTGASVAERIGALESVNALLLLLGLAATIAIVRIAGSLRRTPRTRNPPRQGLAGVRALAVAGALAWLAFLVVAAWAGSNLLAEGNDAVHTYPSPGLRVALALATLAALLTALEVLALVPVWRGKWHAWPKLRYTLGVALLALCACVLWSWNLVGWRT